MSEQTKTPYAAMNEAQPRQFADRGDLQAMAVLGVLLTGQQGTRKAWTVPPPKPASASTGPSSDPNSPGGAEPSRRCGCLTTASSDLAVDRRAAGPLAPEASRSRRSEDY